MLSDRCREKIHVQDFSKQSSGGGPKIFSNRTKMSEKIEVINVRLSSVLIKIIDTLIDQGLYTSRSEFIRDICRNYVLEERYKDE